MTNAAADKGTVTIDITSDEELQQVWPMLEHSILFGTLGQ